MMKKLDVFQRSALREMGNVGSGNAINTLSKYVEIEIRQGLSYMDLVPLRDALKFMGGPDEKLLVLHAPAAGDVTGTLLTLMPLKSGLVLTDLLKRQPVGTAKDITEKDEAKILEIGEALSVSYLGTITRFLDVNVACDGSVDLIREDSDVFKELGLDPSSYCLMLETDFGVPKIGLEGDFVLVLKDNSLEPLLTAIKKMLDN